MTRSSSRLRGAQPLIPEASQPADDQWTLARVKKVVTGRAGRGVGRIRDAIVMSSVSRSEWLSSLYYWILSRAFRREHRAVLAGRRLYARQNRSYAQHDYLLRRNVHMLEKGLSMRPRRPLFALDYIGRTAECYRAMAKLSIEAPDLVDAHQMRWAHDVLKTYFQVVGAHRVVDKARTIFEEAPAPESDGAELNAPYARDLSGPPPVSYEELLQLALRRRSVRWYLPQPVEREKIDAALDVAALAPSACNRQPFEFRIFDDPELLKSVAAIPPGTRGFGHNFPAFAVIVGRMRAFFSERDRHLIYIDGALAAMSFVFALEAQGLASCCINWADNPDQERAMARLLRLDPDERVVMCVSFGYPDPDGLVPFSEKKPLSRMRRFNLG